MPSDALFASTGVIAKITRIFGSGFIVKITAAFVVKLLRTNVVYKVNVSEAMPPSSGLEAQLEFLINCDQLT